MASRAHARDEGTILNTENPIDTTAGESGTPTPEITEITESSAAATEVTDPADAPEVEVTVTDTDTPEPIVQQTFADLGVMPDLVDALAEVGITHPFPIQSMAIPIAVMGTDMIGQARTGTGKTLAFGLSLLQRIIVRDDREWADQAAPGKPQALVVAPTRELALQVSKDLATASKRRKARVLTVYGGVGYEPQLEALADGVEVVVGTPGRLLDLANRRSLDLSHCKVVVLDEADEMLDLGFLPDVERLLAKTPELRQTMLFSATMPSAIVSLARRHLRHPVNIRAESQGEEQTVPATAQFVYQAHDMDKPEVVARILQAEGRDRCMIFCRTKRAAQRVADDLAERGFKAAPIHGDLNQAAREKALVRFRAGTIDVLVATDVAARGIDVTGVTHVINYECPDDEKTYVHRIGRTGRAGASGIAITFVDWADGTKWKVINRALGLPFEEPQETYSTSEHLYHDMGIAPGTTGRLVPAKPREPREDSGRPGRDRGDRGDSRESRESRPRGPRRHSERVEISEPAGEETGEVTKTRRQRRRGGRGRGEAGDGAVTDTISPSDAGAEQAGGPSTEQAPGSQSGPDAGGEESSRPRRRRRSRGRGGRGQGGGESSAVESSGGEPAPAATGTD